MPYQSDISHNEQIWAWSVQNGRTQRGQYGFLATVTAIYTPAATLLTKEDYIYIFRLLPIMARNTKIFEPFTPEQLKILPP